MVKALRIRLYETMLRIRQFEEKLIELYPQQEIKCPIHLCIGQEAIAAGVCLNLTKQDYIFSTHRNHGHSIAKGISLKALMAELFGKRTGCCRGLGGSMHIADPDNGNMGTTAIVGGNIPLAVGAALTSLIKKDKKISVAFFGDGAVDEGTFHECLNFASLRKLPVIFVCENNFYATNSLQSARQPIDNIYQRSKSYGIPGIRVDGNDAEKVFRAVKKIVSRVRAGFGPILIECRTYRIKGHVGPINDYDLGCRPKKEWVKWSKKDPLKRYERYLLENGIMRERERLNISAKINREMDEAVDFAVKSPFPEVEELLTK